MGSGRAGAPALLVTFGTSTPAEWHVLDEGLGFLATPPSLDWGSSQTERFAIFDIRHHYSTAVYVPDVSFAVAWGMTPIGRLSEPWEPDGWGRFSDKKVSAIALDLLWSGAVVHRVHLVDVDGGRCTLPLPKQHTTGEALDVTRLGWTTTQWHVNVARLINSLSRPSSALTDEFESYLNRSGIVVDDSTADPPAL